MASKNGRFQLSQGALIIGVLSLLAAGSWIAFDLYRAVVKTTIPEVLQTQILPLETSINQDTLNDLKGRRQLDETTLSQVQSIPVEEAETGPTSAPLPLQVTPTPTATGSGQL